MYCIEKQEKKNVNEAYHIKILFFLFFKKNLKIDRITMILQELGRYENERQRLKARIAILEKVEEERDKLLELLKNKTALGEKCSNDSLSQVIPQTR